MGLGVTGAGVGGPCGLSPMVCHSAVYQGSLCAAAVGADPGSAGSAAFGGSWTLIRDLAGHHEPEALASLRRDVGGVGQLALLLLEIGDLVTQRGFGGGQLLHLGALREVGTDRAAMVRVSTQTTAARIAARRAVRPRR